MSMRMDKAEAVERMRALLVDIERLDVDARLGDVRKRAGREEAAQAARDELFELRAYFPAVTLADVFAVEDVAEAQLA